MKNVSKRNKMILAMVGILAVVIIAVGVVVTQTAAGDLFGASTTLTITPANPTISIGGSVVLTANGGSSSCTWTKGAANVITFSSSQGISITVTGMLPGMNGVTVTCGASQALTMVTVVNQSPTPPPTPTRTPTPASGITPANPTIAVNGTVKLSSNDPTCMWTSSNKTSVTVSANTGVISVIATGVAVGTSTITANCTSGTKTTIVTVTK